MVFFPDDISGVIREYDAASVKVIIGRINEGFYPKTIPLYDVEYELYIEIMDLGFNIKGLTFINLNLTKLPELPNSLKTLNCSYNPNLTSLPELPNSLKTLYCNDNQNLSELPELPNSLKKLVCIGNVNLTSLPELPINCRCIK